MRYWSNDDREALAGQRVPWNIWEPFPESDPDPIPLLSQRKLESLLRAKNIRSQWAYRRKRRELPVNIPSDPVTYYEDWTLWSQESYLPFEEARDYVRKQGLQSKADWKRWSATKRPDSIPDKPEKVYLEEGWADYGDWLGTGRKGGGRRKDFLPFEAAREYVRQLGLQSTDDWKRWSREERPDFIPGAPGTYYKGKGWTGYGDWLGTKEDFLPFEEAREYVRSLGLQSKADWSRWSQDKRPDFIPSAPHEHYEDQGWVNWGDWLGTGRKSTQEISKGYRPFEEARDYVRQLGLQSQADWRRWSSDERPDFIPSTPDEHYEGKGWVNWGNWLGTKSRRGKDFLPFEEAREYMRRQGLQSKADWKRWSREERPNFIPSDPRKTYREEGWVNLGDWLGTPTFLPFEEARDYVRSQGLLSTADWKRWSRDERPEFIPSKPEKVYLEEGWAGMVDWLKYPPTEETSGYRVVGTRPWQTLMGQRKPWNVPVSFQESELGLAPMMSRHELESLLRAKNIRTQLAYKRKRRELRVNIPSEPATYYEDWTLWSPEGFLPFKKAREYVRQLGLQSKADWRRWSRDEHPGFIPSHPEDYYEGEGWVNWGDWLGTGRKSKLEMRKGFLSFEKARDYVRSQGLLSQDDWNRWSRKERPDSIPSKPEDVYEGEGWAGYRDWLGTTDFLPFEAAREYVRKLGLLSSADWQRWSREKRPDFIPSDPRKTYREEGWVNLGDWLGTGRKGGGRRKDFLPFEKAREYVRKLGLLSSADWHRWSREERPDFIPSDPRRTYREDWVNLGDWLNYPPTEETSGYRVVGARPWQITPSQPVLRVSSEVQAPVAITVEGDRRFEDDRIRFEFLPEWDQLPRWIKRVAAAVAIDMATATVFSPTEQHLEEMQEDEDGMPEDPREFIERVAHSIEEFAQKIVDNPTEVPEEPEHFAGIALGYGHPAYVRPSSITTAINWLINDWTEAAILEALSSFECYEPQGPIPAGEDLEFYYNSDMPELSFSWRFPNPRNNPAAVRDCMEPWLNIWWQEVLHTIAFEFRAS